MRLWTRNALPLWLGRFGSQWDPRLLDPWFSMWGMGRSVHASRRCGIQIRTDRRCWAVHILTAVDPTRVLPCRPTHFPVWDPDCCRDYGKQLAMEAP